jgi:hypothetical protein
MAKAESLQTALHAFQKEHLEGVNLGRYEHSLEQLHAGEGHWDAWEKSAGVYYFVKNNEIVYVGRALQNTGLGTRVYTQINSTGDPKWDRVIKNKQVTVGVICLPKDKWYMAASLEIYLIDKLKPEFNRKVQ